MGILVVCLLGNVREKGPAWLSVVLTIFIGIIVIAYLMAFAYFAKKSPDCLRSERFTLSKMAIRQDKTIQLIDEKLDQKLKEITHSQDAGKGVHE